MYQCADTSCTGLGAFRTKFSNLFCFCWRLSCPVAAERIGKFDADPAKPGLVRLVFSTLICRHSFLPRIQGNQDAACMMTSRETVVLCTLQSAVKEAL